MVFGPSGVGKGTVIRRVLESNPGGLFVSVSVTTRPARPGEIDGVHYRFVSDEEFQGLVDRGELLEHAGVFGARYGSPAAPIEAARAAGRDALLEIDVQGAAQVRERVPEAVLIFLAPPSREDLEARLRSRGTESDEQIARRLAQADAETRAARSLADRRVVNDDLERASAEVAAILAGSPDGDSRPST